MPVTPATPTVGFNVPFDGPYNLPNGMKLAFIRIDTTGTYETGGFLIGQFLKAIGLSYAEQCIPLTNRVGKATPTVTQYRFNRATQKVQLFTEDTTARVEYVNAVDATTSLDPVFMVLGR